jgi:hypothetical protein
MEMVQVRAGFDADSRTRIRFMAKKRSVAVVYVQVTLMPSSNKV